MPPAILMLCALSQDPGGGADPSSKETVAPPAVEVDPGGAPPAPAVRPPAVVAPPAAPSYFAFPPNLPDEVRDQLIDFDTEQEVSIQSGPVTVEIGGQDVTSRAVIRDIRYPVLGRFRRRLTWPEFYERVGHDELAGRWARRTLLATGLEIGGIVIGLGSGLPFSACLLGGLTLIFWDHGLLGHAPALASISAGPFPLLTMAGVGLIMFGSLLLTGAVLAGVLTTYLSRLIPEQPVDRADIMAMADAYNKTVLAHAQPAP